MQGEDGRTLAPVPDGEGACLRRPPRGREPALRSHHLEPVRGEPRRFGSDGPSLLPRAGEQLQSEMVRRAWRGDAEGAQACAGGAKNKTIGRAFNEACESGWLHGFVLRVQAGAAGRTSRSKAARPWRSALGSRRRRRG